MIPYAYEALFNQDSVDKQLTITDNDTIDLGNADIYNESFELEEHLMNGEDIEIGSCYSGIVKFTTSCLSVLKDMVLDFSMVLNNHTTDPFEIGQYKVYSDKYTADRTKKDVVCYDALYEVLNANVMDWYDTILPDLETTVTLKQFRDSFFLHFGITQETITLDNDTMTVEKTVGGSTLSGALVLKAICASNGCFGRINRQGNFEYFYLSNSVSPTHLADGGKYITAEWEDYDVSVIDKLIIRADEEDVGVTIGTGNNVYIMQDNFLLLGKSSADLAVIGQNIYNRICNIAYKPCEIEVKGNLCFEIGDEVSFEPNNGSRFSTFILNRVYKGIQAQRDTYTQEGNEKRDSNVNSLDDELKRLRGKANRLTRTVEETVSELADFEADVASAFRQTASEISAKVDQVNGESTDSFSWEIVPTKFDIKCNGNSVLKVTSTGAEVNGKIKATSGFIGSDTTNGFNITNNAIYNGLTGIGGYTSQGEGIYISATQGIALKGNSTRFCIIQTSDYVNQFSVISRYTDTADQELEYYIDIHKKGFLCEHLAKRSGGSQSVYKRIEAKIGTPEFTMKDNTTSPVNDVELLPHQIKFRAVANNSVVEQTEVSKHGITLTGGAIFVNATNVANSYDEGIRINAGIGGYSTLVIGGASGSTTGTSDGQFWIGTNRDNANFKRKLYIAHAGSTNSGTYFESDSASRIGPALHLGWSGSVASGNAYAVTGGVVYDYVTGYNKVRQNNAGGNDYTLRVLLSGNNNDTDDISTIYKSPRLQFNCKWSALYIGSDNRTWGMIHSPQTQALHISASVEENYRVFLGVRDSIWAFAPWKGGYVGLGSPSFKWGQIYSTSGSINTSDRNLKEDIKELNHFALDFIMNLNPVSYKFKDGKSGRTHYGLIAQDVEEVLTKFKLTPMDFAGFCKDEKHISWEEEVEEEETYVDEKTGETKTHKVPRIKQKEKVVEGEYIYGLRYEEFIAPMIKTIQLQQAEIEELKKRLNKLEINRR